MKKERKKERKVAFKNFILKIWKFIDNLVIFKVHCKNLNPYAN